MVFTKPSASGTLGAHLRYRVARVMSGRRCFGSSWGRGLKTSLLPDPVAELDPAGIALHEATYKRFRENYYEHERLHDQAFASV